MEFKIVVTDMKFHWKDSSIFKTAKTIASELVFRYIEIMQSEELREKD